MKTEAALNNITKEGYEGGLLIDEMSIQQDLHLKRVGEEFLLVGFVEICDESEYMNCLLGRTDLKLATHVLQLLFLGNTGFRFPVAHFPTTQISSAELYLLFWKAVKMLSIYGFTVTYISMDGAQVNRVFMKMLLPEDQKTSFTMKTMLIKNIFDPKAPKISIIMDYSHLMKKIRNNILKSGHLDFHKKHLFINDEFILWEHWFQAYHWDTSVNTFKVHPKLTHDHFHLDSQLKMRNRLAEDVLDHNMLHLMTVYQTSLGEDGQKLNSSIELLKHTSVIVKVFRDSRPIKNYEDSRLTELRDVLAWFQSWEENIYQSDREDKEKCLFSQQTREDLVSCLLGFDSLCHEKFRESHGSLVPSRLNNDAIENIFSQQRGIHNGPNTNPDFLTYCRTMNTIILGEKSISRKSNTETFESSTVFHRPDRKPLATSYLQNKDNV